MYWTESQGVVYMNSGKEIGYEDAIKRAIYGEYAKVEFSWRGVIPVNVYEEMQRIKSGLEKIIKGR